MIEWYGEERERRRNTQEEEEAFTTLWIYLDHRLSFFPFSFRLGFLGCRRVFWLGRLLWFFWKKQACEGAWGVYVLFTTIVLTRDSTRRAGAGFILKKLCFKESKHSFFIPTLCFARLVMSIHPLAP
jgi:hypothetical protein